MINARRKKERLACSSLHGCTFKRIDAWCVNGMVVILSWEEPYCVWVLPDYKYTFLMRRSSGSMCCWRIDIHNRSHWTPGTAHENSSQYNGRRIGHRSALQAEFQGYHQWMKKMTVCRPHTTWIHYLFSHYGMTQTARKLDRIGLVTHSTAWRSVHGKCGKVQIPSFEYEILHGVLRPVQVLTVVATVNKTYSII